LRQPFVAGIITNMATIQIPEPTLAQLKANADARQMPLEAYLASVAAADAEWVASRSKQLAAIESFASGMGNWVRQQIPSGHVVDDSRESIYPDRD
jgi:hypothetical protein